MAHIRTRNRQLYRNNTYSHVSQSKWRMFVEREAFIAKIRFPGNQRSTMEQMTYTNAIVTLPCYVWRTILGFRRPIASARKTGKCIHTLLRILASPQESKNPLILCSSAAPDKKNIYIRARHIISASSKKHNTQRTARVLPILQRDENIQLPSTDISICNHKAWLPYHYRAPLSSITM